MPKPRNVTRPPADPAPVDPGALLPSQRVVRSISVKLGAADRLLLGRCRRLLGGIDGDHYPSVSVTIRLAIGSLARALDSAPQEGENHAF